MVARSATLILIHPHPEELDELANDPFLAKNLHDTQNHVGGGGTRWERSRQLKANDLWHQHVERLTQHVGFGFDPSDTPTEHAQAVDHGRMTVRADQRIG